MARTTGILTGAQYTKLVDIRVGHTVRMNTEAVRALVTRGLIEIVNGRPVILDAEAANAAIAEYDAWADAANRRYLASRGRFVR